MNLVDSWDFGASDSVGIRSKPDGPARAVVNHVPHGAPSTGDLRETEKHSRFSVEPDEVVGIRACFHKP